MLYNYKSTGLIFIAFITALAGCSSNQPQMMPVDQVASFTLPETYARKTKLPYTFGEYEMVIGLFRGQYISVGHDQKGVYYRGPDHCMIIWTPALGENFLVTGVPPTPAEKIAKMGAISDASEGGIWIPYNTAKEKIKYFHYQDFRLSTGDTESKIPPSSSATISAVPLALDADQQKELNKQKQNAERVEQANALQTAQRATGSPANVTANAVGASVGIEVGHAIGVAGLRSMQGEIVVGPEVTDERILNAIKSMVISENVPPN